ncbi:MAG: transglutaminase domain-containing protein [Candidatus Omnitrophica bacterium]|nr:transglutaminase domain-containing protein [Candidatus Omnitrophota bacterium]
MKDKDKEKTKIFKKGIIILSPFLLMVPFIIAGLYEDVGTKNLFIIFSKRVVAEAANLALRFYDPYSGRVKKARLCPPQAIKLSHEELLDTKEKLLNFIDSDIFLKSHLKLKRYDNEQIIYSNLNFFYQPADEPALEVLRSRFHLDEVIKVGKNSHEKLLELAKWVNGQWRYGVPKDVPFNFNAIEILGRAKKGEHFFCSEYSIVFIQCALSLGFQGRYVGLDNHVVSEIWLDDYKKWVMFDPTFCVYFKYKGIPLNCLEIHNVLIEGVSKELEIIEFNPQNFPKTDREKLLKNYRNFYIRMRNDWFTNRFPHWYPLSNSIMNSVEWSDRSTKNSLGIARETAFKNELYWSLNVTKINLIKKVEMVDGHIKFRLVLDTMTPNFSHFKININGKQLILKEGNELYWIIVRGENVIMAQAVNMFGREGRPSLIEFNLI